MNPFELTWGDSNIWYWQGFKSYWQVTGDFNKPPMVLIHGFGASSSHWRRNALDFAEAGFCVYGIDLIGFGKSEQPGPRKLSKIDNEFWAKQLIAFIQQIVLIESNFKKVILIGNSLGSLAALTAVGMRMDLVSAMISAPLPDPALMINNFRFSSIKILQRIKYFVFKVFFKLLPLELIVPLISYTKIINFALQTAYNKSIKKDKVLTAIVTQPARRKTAPRALRSMCIGMSTRATNITAPRLLKTIANSESRIPILLVWGREDRLVPFSVARKLIKSNPWLDLLVLEDAGHCPHDESPHEFNENVIQWLKCNLGKSS
tara:strand:+ start:390 stop:1343 length:954 start_codon:yes stop_codon:yes gene_type:complete